MRFQTPHPNPLPYGARGTKRTLAKTLRKKSNNAEEILWYRLRNRRFLNTKFRRQHPIGPYIVDFCCIERKVIIELDGFIHREYSTKNDAKRDSYLQKLGFIVFHISNMRIYENLERVLKELSIVLDLSLQDVQEIPLSLEGEG